MKGNTAILSEATPGPARSPPPLPTGPLRAALPIGCRILPSALVLLRHGAGDGGEESERLKRGAVHCGAGEESHCSARAAILAASGLAPAPGACSFSSQRKAVEREKTKGPPGRC